MADAVNSRMIVLWGGNGADTRLVDFHFVMAAQQRGAKIVCNRSNRSATAQRADPMDFLSAPEPTTAFALALLDEILSRGWQDDAFLRRHTNAALFSTRDNRRLFARGRSLWRRCDRLFGVASTARSRGAAQ